MIASTLRALIIIGLAISPSIAYAADKLTDSLGGLGATLGGIALILSMLTRTRTAERISHLEAQVGSIGARLEAQVSSLGARLATLDGSDRERGRDLAVIHTKLRYISDALSSVD